MKKFLIKLTAFTLLVTVLIAVVLMRYGGYADYFYTKFTTPGKPSLIIGDSRTFQGIWPAVMSENLKNDFDVPVYNFSFTVAQAVYGKDYRESILKKLDEKTRNGVFVLSVNPWMLAQRENDDFSKGEFFESDAPPHNMWFYNLNPNPEYFFRNYSYFHFKAIFRQISKTDEDGLLQLANIPKDSVSLKGLRDIQTQLYKDFPKKWKKTDYRLAELDKTIKALQKHGKVVLVRMPTGNEILSIEKDFWPGLDSQIEQMAAQNKVSYFNYTKVKTNFIPFDGVHLNSEAGKLFTKALCDSIKKY